MPKKEIEQLVRDAVEEFGHVAEIPLEHPENAEHGDYATSVAFVLAKQVGKNPNDIAQKLAQTINSKQSTVFDKVEAVGGFVNFYLSKEALASQLKEVLDKKERFGRNETLKEKKVMVEFTDPNPFKEFHVGHLYSNSVGESLSRIFEAAGAKVQRVNYQGDVGLHVAKTILGMLVFLLLQKEGDELNEEDKIPEERSSLSNKARWLARCYVLGGGEEKWLRNIFITEGGDSGYFDKIIQKRNWFVKTGELERINKSVYERNDKEITRLYDLGRRWSLEYFESIYKRLGTKFEHYYFESQAAKTGVEIVQQGLQEGIFEKSQGAIIFPGEKYGLHSRVFINSVGLPTYEAKELGLAPTKFKDFAYDTSIIITGNEIKEYFKVLLCAMEKIFPELAAKTKHVTHGMVRLPEGKMSSRTGNVLTGEWLLENVKARAAKLAEGSAEQLSEKEQEQVAEKVAVAAIKYSLLRVGVGKDIIFDFEKSLSLDGDSGPYLLYTYARCKSILQKEKAGGKVTVPPSLSKEERDLLRLFYRFGEVVQEAATKYAPNLLCTYVFDLAQTYNAFYNTNPVLKAETEEQKQFRLQLTAATAQLIQNSLHLLGIQTLEKM